MLISHGKRLGYNNFFCVKDGYDALVNMQGFDIIKM